MVDRDAGNGSKDDPYSWKAHLGGWRIWAEGEEEKGAAFYFTL